MKNNGISEQNNLSKQLGLRTFKHVRDTFTQGAVQEGKYDGKPQSSSSSLVHGKWQFSSKSQYADKENDGSTQKEGHQLEQDIQVRKLRQERYDLSRDLNSLHVDYQELCLVFKNVIR
ncbi:hypothetical protein V6N11_079589 [Hibiscus sabdariffa]|uniref:Uncharacterized protein n=1 Tax=Hibiscus sabdariffa TaxID=183260 RepID=A0ABR2RVU2_9ROSI